MIFKKNYLPAALFAFAIGSATVNAHALKVPAPSPAQTIRQAFALSDITVEYSRPGAKGRVVYGDVVPFGKMWRTGANASTKIGFADDVKIEGHAVPSGTYALYTVPNKDNWEIILYKDLKLGGNVDDFKKENEFLRFNVKPTALNDKQETFTIDFNDISATKCTMYLDWEKTRVAFAITTEIDEKVMKAIEANVMKDNRPYYQAATYYYDNNKDLAKAAEWVDKGIAANPKAYYMVMLKAKIQAKQNDKNGAVATAQKVIELAKADKDDAFVRQAEKLIADLKK
jgi:tetratricopeptide (TPR) repeat protein